MENNGKNKPRGTKYAQVADLLRTTTLSCEEIAKRVGCHWVYAYECKRKFAVRERQAAKARAEAKSLANDTGLAKWIEFKRRQLDQAEGRR